MTNAALLPAPARQDAEHYAIGSAARQCATTSCALTDSPRLLRTLPAGLYGQDAEHDYAADALANSYLSWRDAWAATLGGNQAAKDAYLERRLK